MIVIPPPTWANDDVITVKWPYMIITLYTFFFSFFLVLYSFLFFLLLVLRVIYRLALSQEVDFFHLAVSFLLVMSDISLLRGEIVEKKIIIKSFQVFERGFHFIRTSL